VNKTETRVTLLFGLNATLLLTSEQKQMIRQKLSGRINQEGILKVVSQKARSQSMNKALATERFYALLEAALAKPKKRIATKLSKAQKQRIEKRKKRHSEKKQMRRKDTWKKWKEE